MNTADHSSRQCARVIFDRWLEADDEGVRSECFKELECLLDDDDPTGEIHYIYGQIIYDKQCESNGDTDLALVHFLSAVATNPAHYIAHLYAGHCYHDKRRYREALGEYEAVDIELFRSEYPIWRYVKYLEQKGECLYHVGQRANAFQIFEEVMKFYEDTPYDDLVDPVEVFNVIDHSHPIAKRLKVRIDDYYHTVG